MALSGALGGDLLTDKPSPNPSPSPLALALSPSPAVNTEDKTDKTVPQPGGIRRLDPLARMTVNAIIGFGHRASTELDIAFAPHTATLISSVQGFM